MPLCQFFVLAGNVRTLKDGYILRVPLPRVPQVQSTSPVACVPLCQFFVLAGNVRTLKDGYILRVPLPRVPQVQSTSPVARATIHRNTAHTGYLPIAWIPTWSNLLGSLSGLGRCIQRYIPPFSPVRLM